MKKFICCSDTHSGLPPDLDDSDITGWLHAGDVYSHLVFAKSPKASDAGLKLAEWLAAQTKPVYVVKGNHDCSFDMPFFDKAEHLSGRCVQIAPKLNLLGIGWSGGAYYDLPTESNLLKICEEAKREWIMRSMPGDSNIVLTHYPAWRQDLYPAARDPEGWMFTCVRELIDEIKPMAVIQGHIHELFGNQFIYNGPDFKSLFVYPGPNGGTLSLDEENSRAEFVFGEKRKASPEEGS